MNFKILLRGVAYLVLAVALLATAIALNNRQYPPGETAKTDTPLSTGAHDAELVRCKALGAEAAGDAACKAVWQASRKHFLESRKLHQDRATEPVPAASDPKEPSPALGAKWPGSSLHAPGESGGQPQ